MGVMPQAMRDLAERALRMFRDRSIASPPEQPGEPALRDHAPFSKLNHLTEAERHALQQALDDAGIRMLPCPFAGAATVVSDCDKSERADFVSYTRQLVHELGLDFGDSCRLMYRSTPAAHGDFLCLMHYDGREAATGIEASALSFPELLREIHLGNIDHYHFFSGSGPRVYYLTHVERASDRDRIIRVPHEVESESNRRKGVAGTFNFRGDNLSVRAVAVQPRHGALPRDARVMLRLRDERGTTIALERVNDLEGVQPRFAEHDAPVAIFDVPADVKHFGRTIVAHLAAVEVRMPNGSDDCEIESAYLLNVHRRHVLAMLRLAHGLYNFRPTLLTDHGSRYLVDENSERRHSRANADRALEPPLPALSSRVRESTLSYSVLGDDPESFVYLLPDLKHSFGVRFVNPGGASGEVDVTMHALDAVQPARTRDGSLMYLARRMTVSLPPDRDRPRKMTNDQGTRTFADRLGIWLAMQRRRAGDVFPMYTHLGNLSPKRDRVDPYFAEASLHELQNRVYNISGDVPRNERIWFTRASVFYDHILMLRSIAPHIERPDPNTVNIESWFDPVLQRTLPATVNQLHGLTFYVDDAFAARVFLDGRELRELVRNDAESERSESITIIGADIRHVALDASDPRTFTDAHETERGLTVQWRDDDRRSARGQGSLRLQLTESGMKRFAWEPCGLHPIGAQYFAYSIRTVQGRAKVALVIETTSGGRFLFGDDLPIEQIDATYLNRHAALSDWTRRIAPLYDMHWRPGARPGGPLPSHRVKRISIVVCGEHGDAVELDAIEFLRPLTSADADTQPHVVLGGVVCNANDELRVIARFREDDASIERAGILDPRSGAFIIPDVPRGANVEVVATDGTRCWRPDQGPRLTSLGNDVTLSIDAATAGEALPISPRTARDA